MNVAVLAGGAGSRLWGGTDRAKPLAPIGGRPLLWHILQYYARFGLRESVIATGHAAPAFEDWLRAEGEPSGDAFVLPAEGPAGGTAGCTLSVRLVDTGPSTPTGERLRRLRPWLEGGPFLLSWADMLSTVDPLAMLDLHLATGALVTLLAVHPPGRFGILELEGDRVLSFAEKPPDDRWVSGGMFVVDPGVLERLEPGGCDWDRDVLPPIAREGRMSAYRHDGFWQCMDTPQEHRRLEDLWVAGAPWRDGGAA